MQTYEIFKYGEFINPAQVINSASDLARIKNSNVVRYIDGITLEGVLIPEQNKRGFISVGHIKRTIHEFEFERYCAGKKQVLIDYVLDLLEKHGTTIAQIRVVIDRLNTGQRIKPSLNRALAAVDDNQKNGTGNWFIFLELTK